MFARTKRLTLRPGWPEDARVVAQALSHDDVATKLPRMPWPYAENTAERPTIPSTADGNWCLILAHEQATPQIVGGIGIYPAEDIGGHEIGYWLTPSAWGRGYATEAGRAMLGIARYAMGLTSLKGRYFLDNPVSGNVLRKLGFQPAGLATLYCLARKRELPCATLELEFDEARFPTLMAA